MENRCWAITFFLIIGGLIVSSEASIHSYNNGKFTIQANARFFQGGSEGLYTSSFISFQDVAFVRTVESASKHNPMQTTAGLVEAIILDGKDRDRIGSTLLITDHAVVCCTPELADTGSCSVGEVIIVRDPAYPEWPRQIKIFFKGNQTEAKMSQETVVINKTGMYYLYFMICDPELDGTVISGRTVWKNPDGYLPGQLAPLTKFFGFISFAYLLLGIVWFLRFVQFWKDIIQLHYHITLVIAFGMSEMAVRYLEYANFDYTGMRPVELTMWAVVTFCSITKTFSRLLLLVVSMDYRVMKCASWRVLLLGVIYFVATEALELVEHLGNVSDLPGKTTLSLVVPIALLDVCFIMLVFSSLARTLEKFQSKGDMAKLALYRNITNAFAIYVLLSIAWIGFELHFYASDTMSELRMAWIIPVGWNILFYGLLAVQCVIWAPGKLGQVDYRQTTKMQEAEWENLIEDVMEAQLEN